MCNFCTTPIMFLEMRIRNLLIDHKLINFDDFYSIADKESYLENIVIAMYKKHRKKINLCGMPEFYIDHVPSKMNQYETA
jgi:hypothetical protein